MGDKGVSHVQVDVARDRAVGPRARSTSPAMSDDADNLVDILPTEIADAVTDGSWPADKECGFYRAIVAMTGTTEKDFGAHVFLRWLTLSETNPVPKVMATVPVNDVNDQKLANVQSILRGKESKDNEITIIVSSYDFDDGQRTSLCLSKDRAN
jgi:hypothetical protein